MKPTLILYLAIGVFFLPVCTSQTQAGEIEAAFMRVMETIEHGDFEAFRKLQAAEYYEADQDPSLLKSRFEQVVAYYQRYRSGESKLEIRKGNMLVEPGQKLEQIALLDTHDTNGPATDLTAVQSPLYISTSLAVSPLPLCGHAPKIGQHGFSINHPTRAGPRLA